MSYQKVTSVITYFLEELPRCTTSEIGQNSYHAVVPARLAGECLSLSANMHNPKSITATFKEWQW